MPCATSIVLITGARPALDLQDVGTVKSVGEQVAVVTGLAGVASEELVMFPGNRQGLVFDVDRDQVAVVFLEECDDVARGLGSHAHRPGTRDSGR